MAYWWSPNKEEFQRFINTQDKETGKTALHWALDDCIMKKADMKPIIKKIIYYEPNIELKGYKNKTVIDYANEAGCGILFKPEREEKNRSRGRAIRH